MTYSSGDPVPCLNIPIIDDSSMESCETFTISLSSSDSHVILSPAEETVTIYDDEGIKISLLLKQPISP